VESIDIMKGSGAAQFGMRGLNGVISITTKTGGSDTRNEKKEMNYAVYTPLGYQKPVEFYSPIYETLETKHLINPDFRTTIFWKPDVVIFESGEASFEFYTSDFPTTYSVVIEGLTIDGRIVRQVEKIRIE
jgi:TonB-dependent SusC/RagA subfamily outer membrane receptor